MMATAPVATGPPRPLERIGGETTGHQKRRAHAHPVAGEGRNVRRLRLRRGPGFGRGFGHLFGLLFLFRHPVVLVVIVVVVLLVLLYRRRH
jgi:hypothetical protein